MKKVINVGIMILLLLNCVACSNARTFTSGHLGNTSANIANGGTVSSSEGWIYYGVEDGLYKCKENGDNKEKLFESKGGIFDINVVDDWIYFKGDSLYRIKTDGSSLEQLAAEDTRGGINLMDGKLYYGNEYKMNFDGSEKRKIYNKNVASAYTTNVINGFIYFYDNDLEGKEGIFKMKEDGTELKKIFEGRTDYMVVDKDLIYFQNYEDHKFLYRMKTDGSEVELFLKTKVTEINIDDSWVYFNSIIDNEDLLFRIKKDGTGKQKIYEGSTHQLQVDGEWLYFNNGLDSIKKLYRVRKDGTNKELFAQIQDVELNDKQENKDEENSLELNLSYETKFGEVNAITYPSFRINYSKNWTISQQVTDEYEEVILKNKRGVEIKYTHYSFPENYNFGGSNIIMLRADVTKVSKSDFVPGYVQAKDYSNLGEFAIAKISVTGKMDMKNDSDFENVDGEISYAVLPKSMIGLYDDVRGSFETEFSYWYSGHISFISNSPDGLYTDSETKEIIKILSSFKCVE